MPREITTAYHLVDQRNWESVRAHGLLSAAALIRRSCEDPGESLRRHRPKGERLESGALIRDQSPMPPFALERCLRDGLRPEDWYELLNGKVFFWLDRERLNRQRLACGPAPQIVLIVDAGSMLARYGGEAFVSPFNTGNAMRAAAPRNRTTFVPYRRWLADGWTDETIEGGRPRPASHPPAELTIDGAVPDALRYVLKIVPLGPGGTLPKE